MWNDLPDWVLPLLGILFGGGGPFVAFLAWRSEARKAPIDRSTAKVAEATAISTTANELLKTVISRMNEQDNRASKQDDRASAQDDQIRNLRQELMATNTRLDRITYTWNNWYLDLKEDWDMHRTKNEAPPPPVTEGI